MVTPLEYALPPPPHHLWVVAYGANENATPEMYPLRRKPFRFVSAHDRPVP